MGSRVVVNLDCLFFKGEYKVDTLRADLLLQWKFLNPAMDIPTPDELVTAIVFFSPSRKRFPPVCIKVEKVTGIVAPSISLSYPFLPTNKPRKYGTLSVS